MLIPLAPSASRLPKGVCWPLLLAVLVASCARPSIRPVSLGWSQTGYASWYGPDFHGRRTSSGEVYDMQQLTAAHRDLPLGTVLLVTNLSTGRSVEVRVNDRGPFVDDRILDVSYAAGRMLGMIGPGVIPVRLVITHLPGEGPNGPTGLAAHFTVQAGSFTSEERAQAVVRAIAGDFPEAGVVRVLIAGDTYYRVRVGDFLRRSDAQALARQLAARGYSVLIVEHDR